MASYARAARRAVRGHRGGPHRGEPPGPHPRQRGDGAVEQVRLARAHHRQQVRALGGLRHAVRRHGRRLRRAEGRVQGAGSTGSSAGATRWRAASSCPPRCSSGPPSAELRHEQRDEDSLPPYDVLDAILEGYVEEDLDAAELVARGLPAEDVERVIAHGRPGRVQAPPGAARDQDLHARLRPRPAAADHEPLPEHASRRPARAPPARAELTLSAARGRRSSPARWRRGGRRRR